MGIYLALRISRFEKKYSRNETYKLAHFRPALVVSVLFLFFFVDFLNFFFTFLLDLLEWVQLRVEGNVPRRIISTSTAPTLDRFQRNTTRQQINQSTNQLITHHPSSAQLSSAQFISKSTLFPQNTIEVRNRRDTHEALWSIDIDSFPVAGALDCCFGWSAEVAVPEEMRP